MSKTIVGLTGSFGSGCTELSKFFVDRGYEYISLSWILKSLYEEEEKGKTNRTVLQDYGNLIRERHRSEHLAELAAEIIKKSDKDKWIIDSIRNPAEVFYLKSIFTSCFIIGVYADYEIRWDRKKDEYEEDERDFKKNDERDNNENIPHGQRVRDCFLESDIIISNNIDYHEGNDDYLEVQNKLNKFINMIEGKHSTFPSEEETYMSMAYALSFRSSCLKRKVGAVVVDDKGNLFSSGYNEVPRMERSCQKSYNKCYRDYLKSQTNAAIDEIIPEAEKRTELKSKIGKFKNLDYCRALHAEENAILNVARIGTSSALKEATLYTTTYPCNLCANKIVEVGIKNLIYMELYPMAEAKKILTQVEQRIFEGVTFKGYFKLFGRNDL